MLKTLVLFNIFVEIKLQIYLMNRKRKITALLLEI